MHPKSTKNCQMKFKTHPTFDHHNKYSLYFSKVKKKTENILMFFKELKSDTHELM